LDQLWGRHTVDRFATDYNTKSKIFNSKYWCQYTEAIDSFTQNWFGENNWFVPPSSVICKVIRKFSHDKANGTLVVPLWSSAAYWVLLHDNLGNLRKFITDKQHLIYIHSVIVPGRGNNGVLGKFMKFTMAAFKIRFE
jgi:hypothetical protein